MVFQIFSNCFNVDEKCSRHIRALKNFENWLTNKNVLIKNIFEKGLSVQKSRR